MCESSQSVGQQYIHKTVLKMHFTRLERDKDTQLSLQQPLFSASMNISKCLIWLWEYFAHSQQSELRRILKMSHKKPRGNCSIINNTVKMIPGTVAVSTQNTMT